MVVYTVDEFRKLKPEDIPQNSLVFIRGNKSSDNDNDDDNDNNNESNNDDVEVEVFEPSPPSSSKRKAPAKRKAAATKNTKNTKKAKKVTGKAANKKNDDNNEQEEEEEEAQNSKPEEEEEEVSSKQTKPAKGKGKAKAKTTTTTTTSKGKGKAKAKGKKTATQNEDDDEEGTKKSTRGQIQDFGTYLYVSDYEDDEDDDNEDYENGVENTNEETFEDFKGQLWLIKSEPESRMVKGHDVKFSIDDLRDHTAPRGLEKVKPKPAKKRLEEVKKLLSKVGTRDESDILYDIYKPCGPLGPDTPPLSKQTDWEGVRNYEARNNMMKMKKGDMCLYYHSNVTPSDGLVPYGRYLVEMGPGIVGYAKVVSEKAMVDYTAFKKGHPYFDSKKLKPEKPKKGGKSNNTKAKDDDEEKEEEEEKELSEDEKLLEEAQKLVFETIGTPRWYMVRVEFVAKTAEPLLLKELKEFKEIGETENAPNQPLKNFQLLTRPRLSVIPVTEEQWKAVNFMLTNTMFIYND